jgi:hypothetical protein
VSPEKRSPDAKAIAEARSQPDGWVYHIDFQFKSNEYVPPEAIEGAWKVDPAGEIVGEFQPNPKYREIESSRRRLPAYMYAAATHCAGEWVTEIDPRCEHLFPKIPDAAIVGYWLVDAEGLVTNQFRPCATYDPDAVKQLLQNAAGNS